MPPAASACMVRRRLTIQRACKYGCHAIRAASLLAPADRESSARADPSVPLVLPAVADGVFRLRRDGPRRCRPDLLGQADADLESRGTRRAVVLVHLALDHQDGVRRVGRHRAFFPLPAALLRISRCRPDCLRLHPAVGKRRRMDHRPSPGSDLRHCWRHERHRLRRAGRGGGRHEHGGGRANQPGRQPAAKAGDRPRPRHGAGAGAAVALLRTVCGGIRGGRARPVSALQHGVPHRPDRARHIRDRCHPRAAGDQRAPADRLAHPGRGHRLRRRRGRPGPERSPLQPGDHLRACR